jgi:hypothetical protein
MRKPNPYTQILLILKDLKLEHPGYPISQHISLALSEDEISGLGDEEFFKCLQKYKDELELNTVPDKDIEKIIEEGTNLESLFNKEDEDEWEKGY